MSNENNNGISIQISNESVAAIAGAVGQWRLAQSQDIRLAMDTLERLADKGINVLLAIEAARQARIARYDAAAISRGEAEAGTEV
jgi:hypothetical protein